MQLKETHSSFEHLPNEILFLIFRHFNAQDLFQAFFNLNQHYNQLIQSFHQLKLIYQIQNKIFKQHICQLFTYTLVNRTTIDIDLSYFPNIRRLNLKSLPQTSSTLLSKYSLPYLQHLSHTSQGK